MTRIACVLKTGGEYRWEHVVRLAFQLDKVAPDVPLLCLTDHPGSNYLEGIEIVPLEHNWPGWWSKMELFRPDISGDLLYFDLDTTIVREIDDMLWHGRTALMRDVYRPNGLQSSVMYLAEADRAAVWQSWTMHADEWQERYRKGGDQAFLERFWLETADRWQDVLPRKIVSYKVDCQQGGRVPFGAAVVAFHGKPRPWEVGW